MKRLLLAVLFGSVLWTPMVVSQTSGFTQSGKVTQELRDEGLSIAHSSLPLNSKVRIVNPSNGKEVEATVIRLIPAALGRIADVSSGVWRALELTPITDIRISAVVPAKVQTPAPTVAQVPVSRVTVPESPEQQAEFNPEPESEVASTQESRTTVDSEPQAAAAPGQQVTVTVTQAPAGPQAAAIPGPQAAVTQAPIPRTTSDSESDAEPQVAAAPAPRTQAPRTTTAQDSAPQEPQGTGVSATLGPRTAAAQTAATQTTTASAPRTTAPLSTATQTTAQPAARADSGGIATTGIASLGDMPGGIKFENNNNFVVNGSVPGVGSSAAPSVAYQAPPQPAVTYQPRPQPAPSAAIVDTWARPAQPAVTYQPRPQSSQPAAITDNWSKPSVPNVTYQPSSQPALSAAIKDNWPQQQTLPNVTYEPKPAAAFEMRPQQTQPAVASATNPQQTKPNNDIWSQIAMPAARVETRTQTNQPVTAYETSQQPLSNAAVTTGGQTGMTNETQIKQASVQQDKGPSFNEVFAPASRTSVFIDSPAGAPKPSVTVNNGTLNYLPPIPNEMRQQLVQPGGASQVSAPANSVVRVENWPPQGSQPQAGQPIINVINNETRPQTGSIIPQPEAQTTQQILSNPAATPGVVKFENWTKPSQASQPTVSNVVTSTGGQPVINFETRTIEVPVNQAGVPMWDEIKPPSMNEIYSPVPNSRVFIDAPVDTKVPNVIINNLRGNEK